MKTLLILLFALLFVGVVFALTGMDRKTERAWEALNLPENPKPLLIPMPDEPDIGLPGPPPLFDYHGDKTNCFVIRSNYVWMHHAPSSLYREEMPSEVER